MEVSREVTLRQQAAAGREAEDLLGRIRPVLARLRRQAVEKLEGDSAPTEERLQMAWAYLRALRGLENSLLADMTNGGIAEKELQEGK